MAHPLDRDLASELSYLVLQKRRQDPQASLQTLDSVNRELFPISAFCERRWFVADPDMDGGDDFSVSGFQVIGRKRQ